MSTQDKTLILGTAISGFGYHPGADRHQAQRLIDVAYYRQLVQLAEQGRLDFVLLQDGRALPDDASFGRLDALSVLSRLAPESHGVGLAISVPTTYSEPFHVSRELATLDFVSGGRAAWNPTTLGGEAEAANYGREQAPSADERRTITEEFVEVSRQLWDSWEDDTVITDRERGLYLDPHKLHHINYVGQHFKIRGPQITYRPPQGHVVVIAVDTGDAGVPLDPTLADVLVWSHATLEEARTAYANAQQQAAAAGHELRVLQSILPIVAETEAEAQQRAADLEAAAAQRNGHAVRPHAKQVVGTPAQVADLLAEWFAAGAADGFLFWPAVLSEGLADLTQLLVPELQRRGLFRSDYPGQTLRENLGLSRPDSQFAGAPSEAHTAYQTW